MLDFQMWIDMLRTQSGYATCVRPIRNNLHGSYKIKISDYSKKKLEMGLRDSPLVIEKKITVSKTESIENSTLLRQAEYLGSLAKTSPSEIKPLLFHYAENSFFGFFVYTLFPYRYHAENHGISTSFNGELNKNYVQIQKNGFFARIVDTYHLLDVDTQFSPIIYENELSRKNEDKYSIWNEPKITLEELIEMKQNLNKFSDENKQDLVDFLMLYLASNMARYRPSIWRKIIEANDGVHIIWFNQCFERFEHMCKRLLGVIYDMTYAPQPYPRARMTQKNIPPPI